MIGGSSLVPGVLVAVLLLLSSCGIAQVAEPDIGQVPTGPPTVVGRGMQATGPVTVLGSGRSQGIGWRYSVFESADGTCTQLEMVAFATAACGDIGHGRGSVFGSVATGETGHGVITVDGVVAPGVEAVWIELADGGRVEAELLPLEVANIEDSVFLAFLR